MEKEEILKASRNDNKNKDLADIERDNKASKFAAIAVLLLTFVYYSLEIFIKGETNRGWYSIIALYLTVFYGYKSLRTKNTLFVFCAVIWAFITIVSIIVYVQSIFATSTIM